MTTVVDAARAGCVANWAAANKDMRTADADWVRDMKVISVANNRWGMRRRDDAGGRGAKIFLIDGWKSTWREWKGAAGRA
jgi:hypothetical protein